MATSKIKVAVLKPITSRQHGNQEPAGEGEPANVLSYNHEPGLLESLQALEDRGFIKILSGQQAGQQETKQAGQEKPAKTKEA